ncbi:MAG: hypothetical protein AUI50_01435 [Crenarchaeota archaeon 13_1_40CM_2_52_14]|nr:MAG: hypothetical protein AUI50_01435 [Crenarchaeota archaeon 13_1_40CM_2_52_14]OLE69866.1 MAG: hypothetical protein AUF78_09150 [archaeon 13_1_20CM_2_51_12]
MKSLIAAVQHLPPREPSAAVEHLNLNLNEDPWLGTLEHFPTIYHARASWLYDINTESLQKAILAGLRSLSQEKKSLEITVADIPGYQSGGVVFEFGVGNKDGFDILDEKEVKRLIQRIEEKGTFRTLDLVFHLHYSVDDGRRHKVHQDQYVARLSFQPGRVELLLHHLKGVRRIAPDELVRILLSASNRELNRNKYPELELESLTST